MKKLLVGLLLLASVLMLGGCQQKKSNDGEVKRVFTLARAQTNSGIALFYDEDGKLLFEREIEYPYAIFFDEDAVYYSEDGVNYSSLKLKDGSKGKSLEKIYHPLNALYKDSYFSIISGGICKMNADGSEKCYEGYVSCLIKNDEYLYYIDSTNYLHICDLENFEEKGVYLLESSNLLAFTKVAGKVYIANDHGYTLIDKDQLSSTYIYPNDFTEILNIYDGIIFFEENEESICYKVSFDAYRMVLTPYYNEQYYRNYDLEDDFKEYTSKGYDVVDIHEIGF